MQKTKLQNILYMKSILEGRPALEKEVGQIAEVAGYLWQNGWAERNGGNITVNITEHIDDEIRSMPAISEVKAIGETLPLLLQGHGKAYARPCTPPNGERIDHSNTRRLC